MLTKDHPQSLLNALPPIIGAAAFEVANNVSAPIEMAVSSALATASYVCQFNVDVQRQLHLTSPVSLNFITIAESGDRKTGCDKHFTKPIHQFENQLQYEYDKKIVRYRSDIDIWNVKRKVMLRKLEKKGHSGESGEQEELNIRENYSCMQEEPLLPKFIFGDVTPEALANRFEAWPSIGIISNDAAAILGSGSMQNLGMLNQIWDGNPPRIERISRSTFPIPIARLTMSLMVQPEPFSVYLQKQGVLARSNGFLARSLISRPESLKGERFIKDIFEPSWDHLPTYQERVFKILNESFPKQSTPDYRPRMLSLDHIAKNVWREFSNSMEIGIAPDGFWSDISDSASKAPEQAVRLAAIFHLIEGRDGDISGETLYKSTVAIEYYLHQFKLVFGADSPLSPVQSDAAAVKAFVLKKLNARSENQVPRSWIMKNITPAHLRSKTRLLPALDVLYERREFVQKNIGGVLFVEKFFGKI